MSEKYLGENSTPILINQIKENCTQKRSTLPIASIDELGNTYQYTGTTSGSLVHGYFYECVSDGAVTPTYTWQNVNIQPTVTPTASGTTFDNTTSGLSATNVQGAIDEVVGDLGTAASKDFTTNVAPNNHNLVESNAVYSAINNALTSVYTPRGSITCAELLPSLLVEANEGDVYNVTDSGVTTQYFMQGAGVTINAGDSVGIIKTSPNTYLFNLMGNTIDLHEYQKKDLTQAIESATTVEGALNALSTNKATQTEVNNVKQALSNQVDVGYLKNKNLWAWGNINFKGQSYNVNVDIQSGSYTLLADVASTDTDANNNLIIFWYDNDTSAQSTITRGTSQVVSLNLTSHVKRVTFYSSDNYVHGANDTASFTNIMLSTEGGAYVPYVPSNLELLSYKDNGVLGAKNLLPFDLAYIKSINPTGEWISANAYKFNDVTFTINSDGSVTLSRGTENDRAIFNFTLRTEETFKLSKGKYKLYYLVDKSYTGNLYERVLNNSGTELLSNEVGVERILSISDSDSYLTVQIVASSSFVGNNVTIYPMIRLASDTDPTYQPYAMTNKQLTDVAQQVEGGYILIASGQTVEVTADGTKTHTTLLNELYTAIGAVFSNNPSYYIRALSCRYGTVDYPISFPMELRSSIYYEYIAKGFYFGNPDGLRVISISSNSVHQIYDLGNATINNISSDVPASGLKYIFRYDVYKKIS